MYFDFVISLDFRKLNGATLISFSLLQAHREDCICLSYFDSKLYSKESLLYKKIVINTCIFAGFGIGRSFSGINFSRRMTHTYVHHLSIS